MAPHSPSNFRKRKGRDGGYTPGAGKMTIWDVLDEESWNKGVGVGTYTGDITVTSPDTVEVALKGSKSPYSDLVPMILSCSVLSCRPSPMR